MRDLSSKWTAFTRTYSLRAWLVGSSILLLAGVLSGSLSTDPWKAVDLVFLVVFGLLLSRFTRTLVDSVKDGGDHLLVRRDNQVDRVPLEHIVDVEAGYLVNSGRVRSVSMTLRHLAS